MSSGEDFRKEIDLKEDECCIVFDFSCYYPYVETELFDFGFSMGLEDINDFKLNHRYPNKDYFTLSRKYGRKVSKIGYPYVMKFKEQSPFILALRIGLDGHFMTIHVPVDTKMTKEKPVCALSFNFDYEGATFHFESHEKEEKSIFPECSPGWKPHHWGSQKCQCDFPNFFKTNKALFLAYGIPGEDPHLIYDDMIEVPPSSIEDLMI